MIWSGSPGGDGQLRCVIPQPQSCLSFPAINDLEAAPLGMLPPDHAGSGGTLPPALFQPASTQMGGSCVFWLF